MKIFDFKKDQIIFALTLFLGYIGWNIVIIGLKSDHIILASAISVASILSRTLYKLCLALLAFFFFWIIYDGLQLFPNYEFNDVSIGKLYNLEKQYLGFTYGGSRMIWNEYFLDHQSNFWTIVFGFAYLLWIPAPMIFSLILFFKNKRILLRYTYCFLFVNLIGFIGYYLYPAAAPWYYFEYGDIFIKGTSGDPALFSRFDEIVGIPIFNGIYGRGQNVFAAIPSLHSAFPLISMFYAYTWKNKWAVLFFSILCWLTWIGAVYSSHHYVIDVLAGVFTAIISLILFEGLKLSRALSPWYQWILSKIETKSTSSFLN